MSILLVLAFTLQAASGGESRTVTLDPGLEPDATADLSKHRLITVRRPIEGFSEAGDAAGHSGNVVVEADVLADGKFGPATVVVTSRSELLDAEAIEVMMDASIAPTAEPSRVQVTVRFIPTGFMGMRCEKMVLHARWFETTWPERSFTESLIYLGGSGMVSAGPLLASINDPKFSIPRVQDVWPQVIQDCERQPSRLFLQVLSQRAR